MAQLNLQAFAVSLRKKHHGKALLSSLILIVLCLVGTFLPVTEIAQAAEREAQKPMDDSKKIEGRWVRPDGGYHLQLQDIKNDGTLTATYFNPRPINVSRSEIRRNESTVTVFVELRDVNYPGSTYTLDYDRAADRLRGTYFQAALNQTFEVEFVRVK